MFPFRVQIQQYFIARDVNGCVHWENDDTGYLSFVNVTDFVCTAPLDSPLGCLLILTKVTCFMHGNEQKDSSETSLRYQIATSLSISLSASDISFI